jgi:hypothetical protein
VASAAWSVPSPISGRDGRRVWNIGEIITMENRKNKNKSRRKPICIVTSSTYYDSRMEYFFLFIFFIWFCETIGAAATPGLLCQPRVIAKMIVESRRNVDWQGKPKFSEKTCPSATFVHHKIPRFRTPDRRC